MKTEEIVGLIDGLIKFATQFGGPTVFGALVIALYMLWRTGSAHMLRLRFWKIVYGKDIGPDEQVREFIERRTSLMAFRYTSGIPMRTLEGSRRLAKWLEDNDEDIATIVTAGQYFDREKLELKTTLPSKKMLSLLILSMVFVWVAFASSGALWLSDRGYFTLKQSGQWFSASATDIHSVGLYLTGERTVLIKESCNAHPVPKGAFSETDTGILCSFLAQPDIKEVIEKAVHEQRAMLMVLIALFGVSFAVVILKLRQVDCVENLNRRLREKVRQTSFDF